MANDYYPEPDDQGSAMDSDTAETESDGKTALLPKSVMGGKEWNVGDEIVLKITHIYEDEVAVEYAPEKPSGKEPKDMPGDEEFDLMEKGGGGGY